MGAPLRWLCVEEAQLCEAWLHARVGELAAEGPVCIAVRLPESGATSVVEVPPALQACAGRGGGLLLFGYRDEQRGLVADLVAGRARGPAPVVEQGSPAADPLYGEACALAAAHGRVSLSMIQRRLHIGYTRAKRLAEAVAAA